MRILVVEDEQKIAQSLKKGLEQESYAVDIASDGRAGYDLASTGEYDLILLDRMLPEMNGDTVCQQLRADGIHTPILMLTAKGQVEDRVAGLNDGADDYLVKPFAFEELLARIRALSRRPAQNLNTTLRCGNLSLNTSNFEVHRGDVLIPLSSKEYALLEYLLRQGGRPVNKQSIITHVWNFDADILPNTVEVYIGYLRKKIDKTFPRHTPLIHTVRGFGYKVGNE